MHARGCALQCSPAAAPWRSELVQVLQQTAAQRAESAQMAQAAFEKMGPAMVVPPVVSRAASEVQVGLLAVRVPPAVVPVAAIVEGVAGA